MDASEPGLFHLSIRYVHIFCAVTAFVIGPFGMRAPKKRGWHTQIGTIYTSLMAVAMPTAAILAIANWESNSSLMVIAVIGMAGVLYGWFAARGRKPGWVRHHVTGMLLSYLSLIVALLAVASRHL